MILLREPLKPISIKRNLNLKLTCFKWHPLLDVCAFGSQNGSLYLLQQNDMKTITTQSSFILNLKWSEDGKYLATSSKDCTVKLYTFIGKELRQIISLVHEDHVSDLVFSNQKLITACKNGQIYIWDFEKVEKTFNHSSWVRSLDVSEEFHVLLSGSGHVFYSINKRMYIYGTWSMIVVIYM